MVVKSPRSSAGDADVVDMELTLAPHDLEAYSFDIDADQYALLIFRGTANHLDASELQAHLTPTETAVVALVLDGHSNVEIARARGTSTRTVANQLASAYQKLGVGSRRELASRRR